jgi:leader peptidase (prepilin peptidase)/N-methyltransferase
VTDWILAALLAVAGIPLAVATNRLADRAARRPDARRTTRLPGRREVVLVAIPLLLGACGLAFGLHARAFVAAAFCTVVVGLAAVDAEQHIVPNRVVLPAAAGVLAAQTIIDPSVEWAIAALGAALFFFLAALAYPGGMGMGDVKLALLLGAMLGRAVAPAIAIGMVAAVVPAVVVLVRLGSRGRKTGIPLVPFLALGGLIALFAGGALVDAYLGTFS